jgi:hypothetical protein
VRTARMIFPPCTDSNYSGTPPFEQRSPRLSSKRRSGADLADWRCASVLGWRSSVCAYGPRLVPQAPASAAGDSESLQFKACFSLSG